MKAQDITLLSDEPAYQQFDVCATPDEPNSVFLHEIYDDRQAFEAHLAPRHSKAFDAQIAQWVTAKTVRTYERTSPEGR